jgi:hypothetical protein
VLVSRLARWTQTKHDDLGAALAARGMADLLEEFSAVPGFTWDGPEPGDGSLYAYWGPDNGLHVPLGGGGPVPGEVIVSTVEEAEQFLAKFLDDLGAWS